MSNVVGVVGAGGISNFHFAAFEEIGAQVRIIADLNRGAAERHMATFGAEYTDDYHDVVAHPDVNVVAVLLCSSMHYEVCKAALEAGKHVICEKTLTLSPEDSYELGQIAERKGLILFTSYMKRFFPAVCKAKELMGRLGHIMSVYCRTYQGGGGVDAHTGPVPDMIAPRADGSPPPIVKLAGGGVLICGGSHIFDLLLHLVGKPTSIYGRRLIREHPDADVMFHGLLDLPDGGVAHVEGNWHPLKKVGFEHRGWDEGFEISGVNGRLVLETPVWNEPQHNAAALRYYDNEAETWTEYAFDIVNPFIEAEKYFQAQIEAGQQGEQVDRYVGYRTDLLLATARRSADEDRPLPLEWKA